MTKPAHIALEVAVKPPPVLARSTQQRCQALLRRPPAPTPVPSWEWLVYAASVALCSGYLVQMTAAWIDDAAPIAKTDAVRPR